MLRAGARPIAPLQHGRRLPEWEERRPPKSRSRVDEADSRRTPTLSGASASTRWRQPASPSKWPPKATDRGQSSPIPWFGLPFRAPRRPGRRPLRTRVAFAPVRSRSGDRAVVAPGVASCSCTHEVTGCMRWRRRQCWRLPHTGTGMPSCGRGHLALGGVPLAHRTRAAGRRENERHREGGLLGRANESSPESSS